MDEATFWAIIEAGGPYTLDDQDAHLESVRSRLAALPPDRVREFKTLFARKTAAAYRWDLWGAAYQINGGCSDDCFDYFCAWLVSKGRAVYEAALRDPDGLAGVIEPGRDDTGFESLMYVPQEVYEARTGGELPPGGVERPADPAGEYWDFDDEDETARRLPRLSAATRNDD